MSKLILVVLNVDQKFWIQIFNLKYRTFNIRNFKKIAKSLWFGRIFRKTADSIKYNLWLDTCNTGSIDFLKNPWCFDLPLALKPTFLNMHGPLEDISFSELTDGNSLNYNPIFELFGDQID